MNIIIVGCGKIGQTLVRQLNEEGNNITVIDILPERVNEMCSRYDCMGVVGNGVTHSVQRDAGIDRANLLIAVTGSDEMNLLCCLVAKMSGNCQTIARVKNPEYSSEASFLKDELGLAMLVNSEYAVAQEIARVLRFPSALKIETFAKGMVEILKFRMPEGSPLVGMSVRDVIAKLHCDILICTVERNSEAYIASGDFVFEEKDVISILASPKNANDFFRKINYKIHPAKDIMIIGGGEIAHYLCSMMQSSGADVKILDKDPKRCDELCSQLPDAHIICGNAVDKDLLLEEGLPDAGACVALTNMDEENILLSLYAKNVGCSKVVTKINRIDFDDVIQNLDLDTIVSPKNIITDIIVRYVRAMKNTIGSNVETLYNLIQGKVEAAEFIVKENSPVIGVPLSHLKFQKDVLVAAILRDRKVIIPRGHDMIQPGDNVVIVSGMMALHDISDILK